MCLSKTSLKYHENIKKYILEHFCQPCDFGYKDYPQPVNENDFLAVARCIYDIFYDEKCLHDKRNLTRKELFVEWCSGLPSVLDCDWYYRPCVNDYQKIMEISDKQIKRYPQVYTEMYCENEISKCIADEILRMIPY